MISKDNPFKLGDDQFAFHFSGGTGVEARELGTFLQRAATVARREGAELRVTAVEPGSLAVIIKAIKNSRVAREFNDAPIQATLASIGLVHLVVDALVAAMSPEGNASPLAKVGADMVDERQVEQIEIVTVTQTITIMDQERAFKVREIERNSKKSRLLPPAAVQQLVESGRSGLLSGRVIDVEGELHFRLEGHRYLVPINMRRSGAAESLEPGADFRVNAELRTLDGQPDDIVIYKAERI